MKSETFVLDDGEKIVFHIGQNAKDNFQIIDNSEPDDIWFHIKDISSCHIVAQISKYYDTESMQTIIELGSALCKQNTRKLNSLKSRVDVIYTEIKNVKKTKTLGQVETKNTRICTIGYEI